MAIGWLTALKLVPWGDVIEATPQALKAAKALLKKREEAPVPPTDASGHVLLTPEMLNQWRQEQKTTLEAIEKLATAQASLIAEIERLRNQQRRSRLGLGVLLLLSLFLIAWVLRHSALA